MKKQYIQPSIEVHKIQTMGMLAASSLSKNSDTVTNESDVLARGLDWDDEDEEDW